MKKKFGTDSRDQMMAMAGQLGLCDPYETSTVHDQAEDQILSIGSSNGRRIRCQIEENTIHNPHRNPGIVKPYVQLSGGLIRADKQGSRSQTGEEDFTGFSDLLGYGPSKVLVWLHDELLPEWAEVLSISGTLGTEVYSTLSLPEVDPELLKVYHAFSHLRGEFRSRLAQAIWDAENHT